MSTITEIKNHLLSSLDILLLPAEAKDSLILSIDRLAECEYAAEKLRSLYLLYESADAYDYKSAFDKMKELSEITALDAKVCNALLLISMLPAMGRRYKAEGIAEEMFYATAQDVSYKLDECHAVYGVWGVTDPCAYGWYPSVFSLKVLAIGRLQYEYRRLGYSCECDGVALTENTMVLNIHIPRTKTPLDRTGVLSSYERAAKYFAPRFPGGDVVFHCKSWLLFPRQLEFLSPTSNLRAFYGDFRIVERGEYPDYSQLWRLFDCEYTGDPAALPRDSSLRRAYADLVERGEKTGWGRGVFIYKPEQ